jgi:hypothetical protein
MLIMLLLIVWKRNTKAKQEGKYVFQYILWIVHIMQYKSNK